MEKRWFFDEFGGLWEVFCGSRGLWATCLGDLGGLLWIRGGFYGLLRGLWGSFWGALGGHVGVFGWPVAVFSGIVSENVKL